MEDQIAVKLMVNRVKNGEFSATVAEALLNHDDVFVGRGTRSRLLQAEAHAILTADHRHYATV